MGCWQWGQSIFMVLFECWLAPLPYGTFRDYQNRPSVKDPLRVGLGSGSSGFINHEWATIASEAPPQTQDCKTQDTRRRT